MDKSQANRRIISTRVTAPAPRPVGRPASDLRARTLTEVERAIPAVRGRKAPRMTATQRDSQGKPSAWNRSPYWHSTPAWDHTVSTMPRGEK